MASLLLIVLTPGTPSAEDAAIKSALEGMGHTVAYGDDSAAEVATSAYDGVVMGRVASAQIGSKYRSWAKPLVALYAESWGSDGLSFTTTASNSIPNNSQATVYISDGSHALAGGLANNTAHTVSSAADLLYYVTAASLGAGAQIVGRLGSGGHVCYAGYETGATMANSVAAPARRVMLGFARHADVKTANWDTLLDAAVNWALGTGGGVTPTEVRFTADPPTTTTRGTAWGCQVSVTNGAGAVDTTYTGDVTIATNVGSLTGTTTVAAVSGVATFNSLAFTMAGSATLTVSSAALTTDTHAVTVENPTAEEITWTVTGSGGSPQAGKTISFTSADVAIATVSPASGTTDASGQAACTITRVVGATGSVNITGACEGVTGVVAVTVA